MFVGIQTALWEELIEMSISRRNGQEANEFPTYLKQGYEVSF